MQPNFKGNLECFGGLELGESARVSCLRRVAEVRVHKPFVKHVKHVSTQIADEDIQKIAYEEWGSPGLNGHFRN